MGEPMNEKKCDNCGLEHSAIVDNPCQQQMTIDRLRALVNGAWIEAAAQECAKGVLIGEGTSAFAEIIRASLAKQLNPEEAPVMAKAIVEMSNDTEAWEVACRFVRALQSLGVAAKELPDDGNPCVRWEITRETNPHD